MQDWFAPEAVDRTLQDVLNNEKPFGGITVVFGGDFRQILPVKIKGTREMTVSDHTFGEKSKCFLSLKICVLLGILKTQLMHNGY